MARDFEGLDLIRISTEELPDEAVLILKQSRVADHVSVADIEAVGMQPAILIFDDGSEHLIAGFDSEEASAEACGKPNVLAYK
jgi:hypothetical protein